LKGIGMEERIRALEVTVSQMAEVMEQQQNVLLEVKKVLQQNLDILSRNVAPLDGYITLTCKSSSNPVYIKSISISGLKRIEDTVPYTEVMIAGGDIYRVSETPETILESLDYQKQEA